MGKITEISERILQIIEDQCITPNYFATKLGYNRAQTIYDIINGKSAPSYDFFKRFMMSEYSAIYNIDWVLTGRGAMTYGIEAMVESERARIKKLKSKVNVENEAYSVMTHLIDKIAEFSAENAVLKKENKALLDENENLKKELGNKKSNRTYPMAAEP